MAMIPGFLAGIFYMIMVSANNNCWLIMQNGWRLWAAVVTDLVAGHQANWRVPERRRVQSIETGFLPGWH